MWSWSWASLSRLSRSMREEMLTLTAGGPFDDVQWCLYDVIINDDDDDDDVQ